MALVVVVGVVVVVVIGMVVELLLLPVDAGLVLVVGVVVCGSCLQLMSCVDDK